MYFKSSKLRYNSCNTNVNVQWNIIYSWFPFFLSPLCGVVCTMPVTFCLTHIINNYTRSCIKLKWIKTNNLSESILCSKLDQLGWNFSWAIFILHSCTLFPPHPVYRINTWRGLINSSTWNPDSRYGFPNNEFRTRFCLCCPDWNLWTVKMSLVQLLDYSRCIL